LSVEKAYTVWRIFICFAFGYFLSYALRSVNAAIAPGLVTDLSLNAEQLGKLSSAYLLAFALLQFPLGVWLDRWGARRTESALLLVAAAGCFVFAMAKDYWWLWLGRALIGAGVSGCLMAAYKGFREWFEPQMQSRLAAWMLVAGTCGVLTTTVPVQWLVQNSGWRPVFVLAACLLILSSTLIFFGLPRSQKASQVNTHNEHSAWDVLREPYFWRMGLLSTVFVGGFIAMQSLWVGPWMTTVLGNTPAAAAQKLFVFNFALMLAYLSLSFWLPKLEAKKIDIAHVAIGSNLVGLTALALIAYFVSPMSWWVWLVFAASTAINTLIQSTVQMHFPAALSGRANTLFNLLIFAGAFVLQWGFGFTIEQFKQAGNSVIASYQATMWCYILLGVVTIIIFVLWRPKPPT
jgi:MFS family permease